MRPDQCAALPDSVSFEHAACLPVAAVTPWITMQEHRSIGPGRRVLVLGASGGVGLFAIQLVKMLKGRVVGVCSSRNVELVSRLGATAIDYTQGDALEAARAHGPYDLILHAIGTETYPLATCRSLLSKTGIVELVVIRPSDYLALASRLERALSRSSPRWPKGNLRRSSRPPTRSTRPRRHTSAHAQARSSASSCSCPDPEGSLR